MTRRTFPAAALGLALALPLWLAASPAGAQALRIGVASETTSMDPLASEITTNYSATRHVYDTLVANDAAQRQRPGLATAWHAEGERQWVFDLREGVTFSDGRPFTARDVLFTFCRILNNPTGTPGAFSKPIRDMEKVEPEGDHRIRVTTRQPNPLLPVELADTAIISSSLAGDSKLQFDPEAGCGNTRPWPTVSDFNSGTAAIGTGPYRMTNYTPGQGVSFTRNDRYWGPKPAWQTVELRPVPGAGPRIAALLAGDLDLIENPAARDLARIRSNPDFRFVMTPSTRVIFLQADAGRAQSPFADPGKPNPLRNPKVREALSIAIDRSAIVERVMEDAASPAHQFLPDGMPGALEKAPVIAFDPARAKQLLAEAGYPNGFDLTLHSSNNRYVNDARIAQTVAQYFTRIGVRTQVEAMPVSVFFTRRRQKEFSLSLGGWGSNTGEASSFLRQWVVTPDREAGIGNGNYGDYSDPAFDAVIRKAIVTMDSGERETLLRQAMTLAVQGHAFIPLHFESSVWAFRKGLTFPGRADQMTLATEINPATN